MSIYDLSIQNDYCSKLSKTHSSPYYQTISHISSKHPNDRTAEEKLNLVHLLRQIQSISQTFKTITDGQSYLQECSDSLELCSFKRGEHLILQGDKCKEMFIILQGTVNLYDLKTSQEIDKQKREAYEAKNHCTLTQSKFNMQASASRSLALNKEPSLSSSGVGMKRRGLNARTLRENNSLEGSKEEEVTSKTTSMTIPEEEEPVLNIQRIIKIKSVVAFLRSKNRWTAGAKHAEDQTYEHLPEAEQLFLDNQTCRKKYFKDGACLLSLKDTVGHGFILNEKSLLQDYRSSMTMIAEEDVLCVRLGKDTFRDIMRSELKNLEEKRTFFLNFFQEVREISVLQLVDYFIERTYKMHEKIYNQGDNSQGIYFVKGGGEVKLYLSMAQKPKEIEEPKLDSTQADLFLPNQLRTQRKLTSTVGIVSQGDFFGEESLAGEHSLRKYTALSASDQLVLYYLAPEYFPKISHVCPEIFKILSQRAENRNEWMEEKIKTSEAVKEKSKELFHATQIPPRRFSEKTNSSHPLILKKNNTDRPENKTQTKFLLAKDENLQQISNGNLPSYFVIARSRDSVESKQENSVKSLKAWPGGDISVTSDRDRAKSGSFTRDDALSMRSVDVPSSFKIFDQKRRAGKKHSEANKVVEDNAKREDRTMTGLKKETRTMHAFHSLVSKQGGSPQSAQRPSTHYTPDSLLLTKKGPQFEVKSYTPTVKSPNHTNQQILPNIDLTHYYMGQEDRASPGSYSARRHNLSSSHEFSRVEMAAASSRNSVFKIEASSPHKMAGVDLQAKSPRGSFTQRGESRQDKIILELNQEYDFVRKGSKAQTAVQKQVCQLSELRVESEPDAPIKLNVVGSRQVGSIFKPKAKTVMHPVLRKQKVGI